MRDFYVIWNEKGGAPRFKHTDQQSAKNEAERLARLNKGSVFHVLQLVDSCRVKDVLWESELNKDEIPF